MMIATDSTRCPLPMPMGWFQVLYSHELEVGDAIPVEYFGQELVVFRTESGEAKVVDAFCPHMGAHLGYGIREQTGKGHALSAIVLSALSTAGAGMATANARISLMPTTCLRASLKASQSWEPGKYARLTNRYWSGITQTKRPPLGSPR